MTDIKVTPLGKLQIILTQKKTSYHDKFSFSGAGQDVGRSCILLQMGTKNIMLDCGMHMGYTDEVVFIKHIDHKILMHVIFV